MRDWPVFRRQFKRELLIQIRDIRCLINSCLFFLMILFFFPMTLKADLILLRSVAPGLVWMALLLSLLLSAERLFVPDYEQGVIEQWLVFGRALPCIISAKIAAHWCFNVIPVLLLCPLVALIFSLTPWETTALILSLLCGTPALIFLCALAASFGVGMTQRAALMALILLPLALPILIFASATVTMAMQGLAISGYLALLLAFSVLSISFLPYTIAAVMRVSHV